jgi:hypothetical protein
MASHTFDARLGRQVAIDLCLGCQLLWFDHGESLQLSPASTLKLFRTIGEHGAKARVPAAAQALQCPRCGGGLSLSHDRQRNTPFQYWRCAAGHGRLTSFFDFLREKDFVRPLSPEQIDKLRESVDSLNCSNCGGPVDLARGSICGHCGSPLSMLDLDQAGRLVAQLREAEGSGKPIDPTLPLDLARARRDVETAFAAIERQPELTVDIGAGIAALVRWLGKPAR